MARMRGRFDRHQLCLSHINRVAVLHSGGKAHVAVPPHDLAVGSDDVQVGEEVAQDPVAPCESGSGKHIILYIKYRR